MNSLLDEHTKLVGGKREWKEDSALVRRWDELHHPAIADEKNFNQMRERLIPLLKEAGFREILGGWDMALEGTSPRIKLYFVQTLTYSEYSLKIFLAADGKDQIQIKDLRDLFTTARRLWEEQQ